MTISQIVKQLRACKFKDEMGNPLENNIAFAQLQRLADEEDCRFCPNCTCEDCEKERGSHPGLTSAL